MGKLWAAMGQLSESYGALWGSDGEATGVLLGSYEEAMKGNGRDKPNPRDAIGRLW